MRVYTVYLSTQSTINPIQPFDETSFSAVRWTINWNSIFGDDIGKKARVKYSLSSLSQASIYTWAGNSGTVRIQGIADRWSNSNQGLFLGDIGPLDNPVGGNPNHILYGNTMQEAGTMCVVPYGASDITVLILQRDGVSLQANVLDYQMVLKFEVDE